MGEPAQAGLERLRAFLKAAREPVLLEPGEEPLVLTEGRYELSCAGPGPRIEAWDDARSLNRRIRSVGVERSGRVEIEVERFGGALERMMVIDRARGTHLAIERKAGRGVLRERLRAALARQFPGWRLAEISTEADLEHTLSPALPRALLTRAGRAWAAIAAPDHAATADQSLTFGLVWLDYLRRREHKHSVDGLALLVPEGKHIPTCLRIPWLNRMAARFAVFVYGEGRDEHPMESSMDGNLDSSVPPAAQAQPRPVLPSPEALLENRIRHHPRTIDATLAGAPVYGQIPAWAGIERGVLDLLACGMDGRLAVIEIKASADPHLPMQALDYWLRVRHHQERGDFARNGYFPGVALSPKPPRLLLVAPALEFHPTTETILSYFSSGIEVERVGVSEWQEEMRVLFRCVGARSPC